MNKIKYILLLIIFYFSIGVIFAADTKGGESLGGGVGPQGQKLENITFNLSPIFRDSNPILRRGVTLEEVAGNIVRFLTISMLGLAILGIIIGGYKVMVSGATGADDRKQGMSTIIYGIIGVMVIAGAYAIVKLVQVIAFSIK